MPRKHRVIIAIAVGVALLLLTPAVFVGIRAYQNRTQPANPDRPPRPPGEVPQADWLEIVPKSYWVIGPFGPGLHQSYSPEKLADPTKPCKTPAGKELQWTVNSIIPGAQCLDFRKAFKLKNTDDSAAYALVYIQSDKDQAGELLLGSDDTITVWLNGVEVHQYADFRMGEQDTDKVPVAWKQGQNTLLIKVGNGTGDHLFFAKLRSPFTLRASTTMNLVPRPD